MAAILVMKRLFSIIIVNILIFLALTSCSTVTPVVINAKTDYKSDIAQTLEQSTVTLIRRVIKSDNDGVPLSLGYQDYCNAFLVHEPESGSRFITAKHCVSDYDIGSLISYRNVNGIGLGTAIVEYKDESRDRAFLYPVTSDNLVPIELDFDYEPVHGDVAITYTSLHKSFSIGNVIGELTHGWHDTNQTMNFGWSGSPVVNSNGNAWGIIAMCILKDGDNKCMDKYAMVVSIY